MIGRAAIGFSGLLAAAAVASVLLLPHTATPDALLLAEDGIGPLRLGQPFLEAERLTLRSAPESAFSGPGCAGSDEIRYDGWLGEHPVGVMGMALGGRIHQVEATLRGTAGSLSQDECLALRDRFATTFIERFGPFETSWQQRKPVSRELMAQTGPVILMARWFPAGGSCYVSARYGTARDENLRPDAALAALSDESELD